MSASHILPNERVAVCDWPAADLTRIRERNTYSPQAVSYRSLYDRLKFRRMSNFSKELAVFMSISLGILRICGCKADGVVVLLLHEGPARLTFCAGARGERIVPEVTIAPIAPHPSPCGGKKPLIMSINSAIS